MGFRIASLAANELATRLGQVELEYANKEPERVRLLKIMKAVHNVVLSDGISPNESAEVYMDSWVLATLEIEKEYSTLKPDFQPGYFFSTGSSLYSLLRQKMGLEEGEIISDQRKYMCLEQLYNYFFSLTNAEESRIISLISALNAAGSDFSVERFRTFLIKAMQEQLARMTKTTDRYMTALPTEASLKISARSLVEDYAHEKHHHDLNQERERLAQLVQATSAVIEEEMQAEVPQDLPEGELSLSERYRLGFVLIGQILVDNEYLIRGGSNSAYYRLLKAALNGKTFKDFAPETLHACLCASSTLLNDRHFLAKLEEYGRRNFLDKNLLKYIHPFAHQVKDEINTFRTKNPYGTIAGFFANALAISLMPLGYGAGYVVGNICSATNTTVYLKMCTSKAIGEVSSMVLSTAGSWLGFLAADFFVASSMERAFAVTFQAAARYIGLAAGTGVGIVVDKTFTGLKNLVEYTLGLEGKIDPKLINKEDFDFLRSFLRSPPEVLGVAERMKIEFVVAGKNNLFQPGTPSQAPGCGIVLNDKYEHEPLLLSASH